METTLAVQKKIIDFLLSLPNIHDSDSQRALLYQTGLDLRIQGQIPIGKPPAQFVPSLVCILLDYGKLNDEKYALEAVLEVAKTYVGQDKKAYCDTLIHEWHKARTKKAAIETPLNQAQVSTSSESLNTTKVSLTVIEELQQRHDLLGEKIRLLHQDIATKNDAVVKSKLEEQIGMIEAERNRIKRRLQLVLWAQTKYTSLKDKIDISESNSTVNNHSLKNNQYTGVISSYWGKRSPYSKKVIIEQVCDLALNFFKSGIIFDEENAHWIEIPNFYLPEIWHDIAVSFPMLIVFPTEYPNVPPHGFYLKKKLPSPSFSKYGFEPMYELNSEWVWICVSISLEEGWKPCLIKKTGAWRYGDNLWTYIAFILALFSERDDGLVEIFTECVKDERD